MITKTVQAPSLSPPARKFKLDDLLDREPILLDNTNARKHIHARKILITGASGSIGSELAQQIAAYQPAELTLLDRCESTLAALERELGKNYSRIKINAQLADISDEIRMRQIFELSRPQVVYHAAALKHVPFVENQHYDAIKINILGTRTLADISAEMQVEKFIYVSTDKAVNPSSVMGATKRFGEMIIASQSDRFPSDTQFITTRFGNVLGSSGSVINLFEDQILNGGPVTVTHRDMMRYFMTPFEAGQLLLEAGAIGMNRQVLISRMGKPAFILDLAVKMIRLCGFQPYSDIDIQFTGPRSGEKFYEDLLDENEELISSHHPQIIKATLAPVQPTQIENYVQDLQMMLIKPDSEKLTALFQKAIPGYKSQKR